MYKPILNLFALGFIATLHADFSAKLLPLMFIYGYAAHTLGKYCLKYVCKVKNAPLSTYTQNSVKELGGMRPALLDRCLAKLEARGIKFITDLQQSFIFARDLSMAFLMLFIMQAIKLNAQGAIMAFLASVIAYMAAYAMRVRFIEKTFNTAARLMHTHNK